MENKIIQAARFARNAHDGQARKYTGKPYILHPARVAARATLLPDVTEDMVCAAWLHDVCEDCGTEHALLLRVFGGECASLVRQLTNVSKQEMPDSSRAARKFADCMRLADASAPAHAIKAIDRIDNISEMGGAPEKFYRLYMQESRMLLDALVRAPEFLRQELREAIERGETVTYDLPALIESARAHQMTPEEADAQRQSFVRGNMAVDAEGDRATE